MTELRVHLDRIEEGTAVLVVHESQKQILWPARYLPAGAREGSVLRLQAALDPEATSEGKKRVEDLLDRIERAQKEKRNE